ncbi:MAG: hypothetical protein COY40_04230 [Alphaproteobacteria bacterium CG_4_10_14_0_8_um_filter_53_9]|nr:MAG: hypothetical protein COY40_04230 [Alphaproteobacteria bacterium CG_4_10_14_0_8_um_filter_53_9]
MYILLFFLLPALTFAYEAHETLNATVSHVIDGDTLVLKNGQKVRLLDINTPEIHHQDARQTEPVAEAARQVLELIVDKDENITLHLGPRPLDTYGRLLAHIYTKNKDGTLNWVNGQLVREGFAHVYTFEQNEPYTTRLLTLEEDARSQKKNIWALPRWNLRDAATCCTLSDTGRFHLVQGTIKSVGYGPKGMVYLNFGDDYKTDFTLRINGRDSRKFPWHKKWKELEGKTVLARGKLAPVNGMMITLSHAAQLKLLP